MPNKVHQLSNGITVYWDPMPESRAASIGVWIRAGSRFEELSESGVTHFLEHMCFKGTKLRTAEEIANEMDFLGGEMNAFTGQEMTSFYATVLSENARRAISLLGDLMSNPIFDAEELERERGVVLEELAESRDDPEDLAAETLFGAYFEGHPFGRPILGTETTIGSFTPESVGQYFRTHYHPGNLFITIAGNIDWPTLSDELENAFREIAPKVKTKIETTRPEPHFSIRELEQDFEQTHLCLGVRGVSQTDQRQSALRLLTTHLGGGMSSRLFQEVREKRGLAYSVYATPLSFTDGGIVRISASTRPSRRKELQEVLISELQRLESVPLTCDELTRARNQLKSSLLIGLESVSGRMGKMGKDILLWGKEIPVMEIEHWIDKVTPDEILELAKTLKWGNNQAISIVGPLKGE